MLTHVNVSTPGLMQFYVQKTVGLTAFKGFFMSITVTKKKIFHLFPFYISSLHLAATFVLLYYVASLSAA